MDQWGKFKRFDEENEKFVQHVQRKSNYKVIGPALLQTTRPLTDCAALVIYVGEDGQLWARAEDEFNDENRFISVTPF